MGLPARVSSKYFAAVMLSALLASSLTAGCSDDDYPLDKGSAGTSASAGDAGTKDDAGSAGEAPMSGGSTSHAGANHGGEPSHLGGFGGDTSSGTSGNSGGGTTGSSGTAGSSGAGSGAGGTGGISGGGTGGIGGISGGGISGGGTSGGGTGGISGGGGGIGGIGGISGGGTGGISGGGTGGGGIGGIGGGGTDGIGGGGIGGGGTGGISGGGTGGISGGIGGVGDASGGNSGGGIGGIGGGCPNPDLQCSTPYSKENCGPNCNPITSAQCLLCEEDASCNGNPCSAVKNNAQAGAAAGTPRAALCNEALSCFRTSKCANGLTTNAAVMAACYCGASVPYADCDSANAAGPCRLEFERALETTDKTQMQARLSLSTTYGAAQALTRILCDVANCTIDDQCF